MNDRIKTAEKLPEKEALVEVKSNYFPDGANYVALADTEQFGLDIDYNSELFCIGSDPFGIEVLETKFSLLPEWWFPVVFKMEESLEKEVNEKIKAAKKLSKEKEN